MSGNMQLVCMAWQQVASSELECVHVCVNAGLQEGLRALHRGGIRPGMLIIDDGWQCTDVDKALRDPSARKPPVLPGGPDNTAIDEFYDAELEMLRMGAKDIPGGSSLGAYPVKQSMQPSTLQSSSIPACVFRSHCKLAICCCISCFIPSYCSHCSNNQHPVTICVHLHATTSA